MKDFYFLKINVQNIELNHLYQIKKNKLMILLYKPLLKDDDLAITFFDVIIIPIFSFLQFFIIFAKAIFCYE